VTGAELKAALDRAPVFPRELALEPVSKPPRAVPSRAPYLAWCDAWTLDVGFMDDDHRTLAALLNRLARDYGQRSGLPGEPIRRPDAPPLLEALAELALHTREHFHREEEVMRNDGYPVLPVHKSEHEQLLAELSILSREIAESGRQWLAEEQLDSLKDWFLGHMLEQDRALADFLKRPAPPSEGGPGL
jgi:hemerythrin-like metal-binding protein